MDRDRWVSSAPWALHNIVVGGDSSEHTTDEERFLCYAVAAAPTWQVPAINAAFEGFVSAHTLSVDRRAVEVHAKELWNGSERARSPFASIQSKKMMLAAFDGLASSIRRLPIATVVAVRQLPKAIETADYQTQKRFLIVTIQVVPAEGPPPARMGV